MTDPLLDRLAAPDPGAVSLDVVDTFTTTAGPLGDVLVASSSAGVTFLRPADDAGFLTGIISPITAGSGNAIVVKLTPKS